MERYFIGNNTGYKFYSFYPDELKRITNVVLMKGGPGTGKSTILKGIASECEKKGYKYEKWYCSGDPYSLDGIYVLDKDFVIIDATSPHAMDPTIPVIKEKIVNLADSLNKEKLIQNKALIEKLLNDKGGHFVRVYQHLNSALVHYKNKIELQNKGVKNSRIKSFAFNYFEMLQKEIYKEEIPKSEFLSGSKQKRNLFTRSICPSGESEYFGHLENRNIVKVNGNDISCNIFYETLASLLDYGTFLRNPLEPKDIEGILIDDIAVVSRVGFYENKVSETIELGTFEGTYDVEGATYENNQEIIQVAFAVEELNLARDCHLSVEKYYVEAMDFTKNNKILDEIKKEFL